MIFKMMIEEKCPECDSDFLVATGKTSSMYMCKSCGYIGGHDESQLSKDNEFDNEISERPSMLSQVQLKPKKVSSKKTVRKKR